jgi:hypothetical protein
MKKIRNPIKNLGAFAHPPKAIGKVGAVKRVRKSKPKLKKGY